MIQENSSTANFELTVKLIEVVIWPLTLFLIIFFFRKSFAGVFQRLGTLKVDSSGIAMSFEKELEATKSTFELNRPEIMSRGKSSFDIENASNEPPFQQLMTIKQSLDKALIDLASEEGIDVSDKSGVFLCNALEAKAVITKQKSELTKSLLKVVNMARMDISQSHIDIIKKMYNAL
ncbi:MAG: hypothetical protein Q7U59_06645 [Lutibacter sp.]|nr:hypothetical protein [Lutibacter sp.]